MKLSEIGNFLDFLMHMIKRFFGGNIRLFSGWGLMCMILLIIGVISIVIIARQIMNRRYRAIMISIFSILGLFVVFYMAFASWITGM